MGCPRGKDGIAQRRFRRRARSGEGRISCPLTHRRAVAEISRSQVDRPHRSVYPGSLLHHLLHALDGYGISALVTPALGWLQKAPEGLTELQHKLLPVKKSVAQVSQATAEIEKLATTNAGTKTVEVKRHPITEMFFMRTPEFIASAILLSILLYFLLVY